jgi:hypothetical protein
MPVEDRIHNSVKSALIKDGWTITADPYRIEYKSSKVYADLRAERPIAAERGNEIIIVEIKSFLNNSLVHDFHNALGQYLFYRSLLELTQTEFPLYLAVSIEAYEALENRDALWETLELYRVALVVVNLISEEIVRWITWPDTAHS